MAGVPIVLNVTGRRCLVVGGGSVALRRARALAEQGAAVVVVAPQVLDELAQLPGITVARRAFAVGDVAGALLVVVATDNPAVNRAVSDAARAHGVLVNRADDGDTGDLAFAAHARRGPVLLAVHTGGISAAAAAAIRDELAAALDPRWPALLDAVAPCRDRIQREVADEPRRRALLAQLADATARAIFRDGGAPALHAHLNQLLAAATAAAAPTTTAPTPTAPAPR